MNLHVMEKFLAVVGKGGVGKTTVTSLLAKALIEKGYHPLLIDADPTLSHLSNSLGIKPNITLEGIRKEVIRTAARKNKEASKKLAFSLDDIVGNAIFRGESLDLFVVGQPQDAGCFCPVNDLLKEILRNILDMYQVIIIDCEAGLEQISRKVIRDIDYLLIVTEYSRKGVETAKVIKESGKKFTRCKKVGLIINNFPGVPAEALNERIRQLDIPVMGHVPVDPVITDYDIEGKSLLDLPATSTAWVAMQEILKKFD